MVLADAMSGSAVNTYVEQMLALSLTKTSDEMDRHHTYRGRSMAKNRAETETQI